MNKYKVKIEEGIILQDGNKCGWTPINPGVKEITIEALNYTVDPQFCAVIFNRENKLEEHAIFCEKLKIYKEIDGNFEHIEDLDLRCYNKLNK